MVKTTPFYPRTGPLNETMLWEHWAGYLVARQYQYSEIFEYYAIRNSAGISIRHPYSSIASRVPMRLSF